MDNLVDVGEGSASQLSLTTIQSDTDRLTTQFQDSINQGLAVDQLRGFAQRARDLSTQFHSFMTTVPRDQMDSLYPNRGELYRAIAEVWFNALDNIPFDELNKDEQGEYLKVLFEYYRGHFDKEKAGYYHFGWPALSFEKAEERKLLEAVTQDRTLVLDEEQENRIFQTEEDVFKIHLNVPRERRIETLKAFLRVKDQDAEITTQIFKEKAARGESQSATYAEIHARGGQLDLLHQWKMKTSRVYPGDERMPDFVIYVPGMGKVAHDVLPLAVREIAAVAESLDLPRSPNIPRFNTPVVIDGREINGLFLAQGNSDFKDYLLRTGGEEKLGRFYDSAKNYALQKGVEVNI